MAAKPKGGLGKGLGSLFEESGAGNSAADTSDYPFVTRSDQPVELFC